MEKTVAISCGIGRGHPHYLLSVLSYLPSLPVFRASGPAWTVARLAYRLGAKGGIFTRLYNRLRPDKPPDKFQLYLFEFGNLHRLKKQPGVVLVDHPLLAHLLSRFCRVAYLHAEPAAPRLCAVPAAWRTFVPLEHTAAELRAAGVPAEKLFVTGLVIEPPLLEVAAGAYSARIQRLSETDRLTVGFFLSGASPPPHIRSILSAARSLAPFGHRGLIFCGTDFRTAKILRDRLSAVSVFAFRSYSEETLASRRIFHKLDVLVCAAHERTNWAVGLGLPMFALLPHIGRFARLNYRFAQRERVCLPLSEPKRFGTVLTELLHSRTLVQMAAAGWGRYPLTGAKAVAHLLSNNQSLTT